MASGSPGEHGVYLSWPSSTTCVPKKKASQQTWPRPDLGSRSIVTNLFKVRRLLDLAHGLHEGVLDDDGDVGARVALGGLGELAVVLGAEGGGGVADGDLEHGGAGGQVGQADVDAALEAAADGGVELPGNVCGAEDEDALAVLADAVHLHQHLRLDAPRRLALALAAGAAQRVDLVDEDDGRLVLARHGEELLD